MFDAAAPMSLTGLWANPNALDVASQFECKVKGHGSRGISFLFLRDDDAPEGEIPVLKLQHRLDGTTDVVLSKANVKPQTQLLNRGTAQGAPREINISDNVTTTLQPIDRAGRAYRYRASWLFHYTSAAGPSGERSGGNIEQVEEGRCTLVDRTY